MGRSSIKGDIAELAVAKRFMEKGYHVCFPFSNDTPYDLIVDINGKFKRVQIKYSSGYVKQTDCITCKTHSSTGRDYREHCDMIVLYNPVHGCYLIDLEKWKTKTGILLRLSKAKNNQTKKIHFAEDYRL